MMYTKTVGDYMLGLLKRQAGVVLHVKWGAGVARLGVSMLIGRMQLDDKCVRVC